jgi:hypothetical protein
MPGSVLIFAILGFLALNIGLLLWVYGDGGNRGMENAVMWVVIVLLLGPLGAIIYLAVRPRGKLTACSHCGRKRVERVAACPHCATA